MFHVLRKQMHLIFISLKLYPQMARAAGYLELH